MMAVYLFLKKSIKKLCHLCVCIPFSSSKSGIGSKYLSKTSW